MERVTRRGGGVEVLRAVGERDEGWIFSGLRKEIGNGRNTLFLGGDVGRGYTLKLIFPRLYNLCQNKALRVWRKGDWCWK